MPLVSNAPIVIPKNGDTRRKKDFLTSLTGKKFLYETRLSPRAGAAKYFTISEEPVRDLTFDRLTGKISGIVTTSGVFTYRIVATNDYGEDYVDVEIAVRKRGFTAENQLSEIADDPSLVRKAAENINIDPDMIPILKDLAEDPDPWIRNDFACMVGYSRNLVNASQIDVQAEIDSANAKAESIQLTISEKLSDVVPPTANMSASGAFIATQFWKGTSEELVPSRSEDFFGTQYADRPSWQPIDGLSGDGDKIEITPPSGNKNAVLIEGTLLIKNGITVANQYYEKNTPTFDAIKAACENDPANKIRHYPISVGEQFGLKLPLYKPSIPGI